MTKSLALALCLILAGVSCIPAETSAYRRTPGPTTGGAPVSGPGGIQREPADLPVLPGESAVMSAFARAGMPVRMVGASKFEGMLGSRQPARVFTAAATWGAGGADVLFLEDNIREIRVCERPGSIGRTEYTLFVNGSSVNGVDAGQLVIFSIGPGYFVQAFDTKTSDALRQGLGLGPPGC
jgi:hypothetical protein